MINRCHYFFFLLWAIGMLLACKKESKIDIPEEFPVDLIAERWEVREETRLFSDNREVLDETVIQRFEEKENLGRWIKEAFGHEGGARLQFDSELTASFYPYAVENLIFDIERKGTRFLFYSQDTYGINPSVPPLDGSLGFLHAMLKYDDRLRDPSVDGMRQTREVWVGHGNYKVLKMSAFAYALRLHMEAEEEPVVYTQGGMLFNEFDTDVIKFLGPADTLAVKEYSIIYSHRK